MDIIEIVVNQTIELDKEKSFYVIAKKIPLGKSEKKYIDEYESELGYPEEIAYLTYEDGRIQFINDYGIPFRNVDVSNEIWHLYTSGMGSRTISGETPDEALKSALYNNCKEEILKDSYFVKYTQKFNYKIKE